MQKITSFHQLILEIEQILEYHDQKDPPPPPPPIFDHHNPKIIKVTRFSEFLSTPKISLFH